ncbi:MAG: O-antigen ligase family protein [Anaerolineae bacterium]|nr:O-antigen ligase family protein [Anaerolineae bacterium]
MPRQWLAAAAALPLLLLFPLARHWIIVHRPVAGVYYAQTSFLFYLADGAVILLLLAHTFWSDPIPARPARSLFYLRLPLTLLTVLALLSPLWALDGAMALYSGIRLLGLFLLLVALERLRPQPAWIVGGVAVTLLLQSLVALLQFIRQQDLGWQAMGEISMAVPGLVSVIRVGEAQIIRGYGLTPHPNILGGMLVSGMFLLLPWFLQARRGGRVFWLLILGISMAGAMAAFSRSAWLAGLLAGGLFLGLIWLTPAWRPQVGRLTLIPVAAALLILTTFFALRPELFLARFTPAASYTESRSLDERSGLSEWAWQLVETYPLTGVGAGGFALAVREQAEGRLNVRPQPVHSIPLLVTAELGIVGGMLWLWLMVAPLVGTIWAWRRQQLTLWGLGLAAALLALAITDLFDFYSWGWVQGQLWRWTLWALWSNEFQVSGSRLQVDPLKLET